MTDQPKLTVQQILAFEADCLEHNPLRRAEAARRALGIKTTRYVQLLLGIRNDPEKLRRALELDPITTNRMLERLDRSTAQREQLTGRSPR